MVYSADQHIPRVRERLAQAAASGRPTVDEIVLQPLRRQGKLTRPQLLLLSAGMFGPVDERVIDVAVAIECIHTASLVHDDIVDEAWLRRGIPTSNHLFGSQAAVLVGDHLFATAFEIVTGHGLNDILGELSRAIRQMCAGEIAQDLNLFNTALTEQDYLDHIFGKTASLFAAACRSGALAAGAAPQETALMGLFGEYLGYAYQIADDVMDFIGDEEAMGKPRGGDLRNGVVTLPVIRALAVSERRSELANVIGSRRIDADDEQRVIDILGECGAIAYAASQAFANRAQALLALDSFPPTVAQAELRGLCSQLIRLPWLAGEEPLSITAEDAYAGWRQSPLAL